MNEDRLFELATLQAAGRPVLRCEHDDVPIEQMREMILLSPAGVESSYLACEACERLANAVMKTVPRE